MKHIVLRIIFVFLPALTLIAGESTLRGKVVDAESSAPLPGVTIRIEGTTRGAISKRDGSFLLKVETLPAILRFSSVGYAPVFDTLLHEAHLRLVTTYRLKTTTSNAGEVIVSGNRSEQLYSSSPVKVSILSDKIFEQTQSVSMLEGLRFQPGLRVENSCQNCGASNGARINGMEGAYTQILIDSRPVFSALNAVYGLEQLPPAMIDRVEIIRGGGSSLFGANAIAGTVNIITKDPVEDEAAFSTSYDYLPNGASDRVYSANGSLINSDNTLGAYVFTSYRNRNEFDANMDGFTELPRFRSGSIGVRGFYSPSTTGKLTWSGNYFNDERRGGNNLDAAPHDADIAEQISHNITAGSVGYEQYLGSKSTKIALYASGTNTQRSSYYGTGKDPNAYGISANTMLTGGVQFSTLIDEGVAGSAILTSGVELTSDRINDEQPGYNRYIAQQATTGSAYTQCDWNVNDMLTVMTGLRADKHSLMDNVQLNPRLTIMLQPTPGITTRLTGSTGFRPPAVFNEDLHISMAGGEAKLILLSPMLQPERSTSFTASIDWDASTVSVPLWISVDGFFTRLRNSFVEENFGTDASNNRIFMKTNGGGSTTVSGINIELKSKVASWLDVQCGLTVQRAGRTTAFQWGNTSADTTTQVLRTPSFYGYMTNTVMISESLSMNLSGVYTGSMTVARLQGYVQNDMLVNTPSFMELNIRCNYSLPFAPSLTVSCGVNNIFNAYQQEFDRGMQRDAGFVYGPLRPRSVYAALKVIVE
ncbi:MAG: TonB-dependent receptor [Candidatus Kapabacteria bacterium]|nr:TonB-dependent receptor [Candidatus Kapabacteria bacterium]